MYLAVSNLPASFLELHHTGELNPEGFFNLDSICVEMVREQPASSLSLGRRNRYAVSILFAKVRDVWIVCCYVVNVIK